MFSQKFNSSKIPVATPAPVGYPRLPERLVLWSGYVLIVCGLLMVLSRQTSLFAVPSDFTNDYVAAKAWRAGLSIYADFSHVDLGAPGTPPYSTIHYDHPPFVAVLFLPLTLLSHTAAVTLWTILSLVLYIAAGWLVLRELQISLPRAWNSLVLGLALCWYPFQAHIALGQLSLLLVGCIVGCWVLLRRHHDAAGGMLLGLACLIKLFPGFLLVYLLFYRRWRAMAATLITFVSGMLASVWIFGIDDVLRYQSSIAAQDVKLYGPLPWNASLTGAVMRLLTDGPWVKPVVALPTLAWVITVGLSLTLLIWLGMSLWQQKAKDKDAAFALICVAMLLLSPITWQHILPVLVLPFGILFRDLRQSVDRRQGFRVLCILALVSLPDVLIGQRLASLYAPYRIPWFATLPLYATTVGLLLLLVHFTSKGAGVESAVRAEVRP